mgnify:CR=1 FL=1
MAKAPNKERNETSSPDRMPETSPHFQQSHDFTLQTIIQVQHTLGKLDAKVDRLITDVAEHGTKIDKIRMTVAWCAGAGALAGALIGLVLALLNSPLVKSGNSQPPTQAQVAPPSPQQ